MPTNKDRSAWAEATLLHYKTLKGETGPTSYETVTDLLTDLHHNLMAGGLDAKEAVENMEEALELAAGHFEAEVEDGKNARR